jgi:hypothetical protein
MALFSSTSQESKSRDSNDSLIVTTEKFFGRNQMIPIRNPRAQQLIGNVTLTIREIHSSQKSSWHHVADQLSEFRLNVEHSADQSIALYKMELLSETVLPYLNKLKGRFHTDDARSRQIQEIVGALNQINIPHPAVSLLAIEKVRDEIKANSGYFFSSELLTLLNNSLDKQWRPILQDYRCFLQDICGKMIAVTVITLIGWPMVLLAPLLLNAQKLLLMVNELEKHKRLSPTSIMLIIQIAAVIFILSKLMFILQAYQSIGYLCGFGSVVGYAISINESLMKSTAPMIIPNAALIDQLMSKVTTLDLRAVANALTSPSNHNDNNSQSSERIGNRASQFPTSNRISEVIDLTEDTKHSEGKESKYEDDLRRRHK